MKRLEHSEMAFAATGQVPNEGSSDRTHQSTFLRLVNSNYRASEALARMDPHQRIPLTRALIARGKINEALEIISDPKLALDSGESQIEAELERARIFANRGQWNDAMIVCGKILADPFASLLTRAAALQVRATGWLETMNFPKALIDLDQLEDLCSLLPRGQIAFYARILRVKLLARTEGYESAQAEMSRILLTWKSGIVSSNLDEAFTFVRLALDLSRLAGKSHADLALASVNLAKALGDETYAGLAYLDLWASLPESQRPKVARALSTYLESQPRVASLHDEITRKESNLTDTAQGLVQTLATQHDGMRALSRHCDSKIEQILFLNSSVVVNLTERKVSNLSIQPRMRAVLEAIAVAEIPKEELFKQVWKMSKYTPERHDTLVRTALMRVRSQTGFEILSNGGTVALSSQALILSI